MPENGHYSRQSSDQLMQEQELDRLLDDLQDLEQECRYPLLRTSVHVAEAAVKSLEMTLEGTRKSMQEMVTILQERGFGERLLARWSTKKP